MFSMISLLFHLFYCNILYIGANIVSGIRLCVVMLIFNIFSHRSVGKRTLQYFVTKRLTSD